ncbi:MAG: hypothetical protein WCR01_04010 [Bacteroidota bacterium]
MCTLFNSRKPFPGGIFGIVVGVMIMIQAFAGTLRAQPYPVTVSIAVTPPYTSKIDDYISQPNKVMAILINTGTFARQVYVQGVITGEGGILVKTDPTWKSPQSITLQPAIPFRMNRNNIEQVFNGDHIIFQGITKNELLYGNGLPEGDYTICLRVFDYTTGQAVSAEEPLGCSNNFNVTDLEPPVVIRPSCGDTILASIPQNLLINWTRPPNCPINTQFNIKIIEVLPGDRNINDAMRSATHPSFFERTINMSSYAYGAADPALVPGKKYAFAITAIDPAGKANFRNKGMSEVCWFIYKQKLPDTKFLPDPVFLPLPKVTTVKGKLIYKYEDDVSQGSFPLADANIKLEVRYKLKVKGVDHYLHRTPYGGFALNDGAMLAITKTGPTGLFSFSYIGNEPLGEIATDFMVEVDGYYQTGDLYRDGLIVIENPHHEFYLNNFIGYVVNPGTTVDIGTLETPVRSCKMTIQVRSPFANMKEGEQDELYNKVKNLQGAQVYLLRKPDFSYHLFPEKDGLPKPNPAETMKGMKVIAKSESDANGEAVFNNIVWHHNPNYTYYVYVRMRESDENNYAMISDEQGVGNILDEPIPLEMRKPFPDRPDPSAVSDFPDYYANFGYLSVVKVIRMSVRFPAVLGQVIDEKENKPLKGAKVKMIEYYKADKLDKLAIPPSIGIYTYDRASYFQALNGLNYKLITNSCPCSHWMNAVTETQADGKFIFNDIAFLYSGTQYYNGGTHDLKGPTRSIFVSCDGYTPYFGDVKGGTPLRIGEKFYLPVILKSGADIKGRIIDAETNKGVFAYFRFLTDSIAAHTNSNGAFSGKPARKLPNQKQYLVIEAQGYQTDTVAVTVSDPHTDLGDIPIYSKKRRLLVRVIEEYAYNAIPWAQVEIVGVTVPCNKKEGDFYVKTLCPLTGRTDSKGMATFGFENAGDDNNQYYTVKITMPDDQPKNYEAATRSIKIPYSDKPVYLEIKLLKASCLFGTVYAGKTDSSAVPGALVYVETSGSSAPGSGPVTVISTTTGPDGKYLLRNVPLRNYKQVVRAVKSKSQFVGDSICLIINSPNTGCTQVNFHLKVYDNMDITNLMGFPMYVTSLRETGTNGHAIITGSFFGIHSNKEFSVNPNTELRFVTIEIEPSPTLKNKRNIPVSSPVYPPVKTLENSMPVKVYNAFDALVTDQKIGIEVDKSTSTALFGAIKGKVKISNVNFNVTGFILPDVNLAMNSGTDPEKLKIHVLNGDSTILYPVNMVNGFYTCDPAGKALKYSLPGFQNAADASLVNSFLKSDRLVLNTKLRTSIPSANPPGNLLIDLGDVGFMKNNYNVVNGTQPLSMPLGAWTLQSSNWKLSSSGLTLNAAVIKTGIDVRCENLRLNYYGLESDKAIVHMDTLRLLGVKEIYLPTTNKGLLKVNTGGTQIQWQLYASTGSGSPVAGFIQGLTAMEPGDRINFSSVRLFSDGSQAFVIKPSPVKVNHLLFFTPYEGGLTVFNNWFKIRGEYNLGFPNGDTPQDYMAVGNCKYELQGNNLVYSMDNLDIVKFTHKNLICRYPTTVFTENLFLAHGTVEEPGQLAPVKTTLRRTPSMTKIEVDTGVTIPFSVDKVKYFKNVTGDMMVTPQYAWNTFWFEGEMVGLKAISEQPQRMKFIVDGTIQATDQQISVSNIGSFPGMKWTYDFPNSRLTGSCDFSQNLGGISVDGLATCIMDVHGWYFQAGGQMTIPGIGGGNLYGLFGDYDAVPPALNAGFGSFKCIPSSFQNHVSGFLISAGVNKPIVDPITISAVLLTVEAGLDLSLNARSWMSFDEGGTTFGIGVLAEGNAYFNGNCEATCSSLNVGANAQFGISGTYNTSGLFNVDGCSSLSLTLRGEQCVGAMGVCCGSCCLGVDILDVTLGANVHYDNNNGVNMNLITSSCNTQCP